MHMDTRVISSARSGPRSTTPVPARSSAPCGGLQVSGLHVRNMALVRLQSQTCLAALMLMHDISVPRMCAGQVARAFAPRHRPAHRSLRIAHSRSRAGVPYAYRYNDGIRCDRHGHVVTGSEQLRTAETRDIDSNALRRQLIARVGALSFSKQACDACY